MEEIGIRQELAWEGHVPGQRAYRYPRGLRGEQIPFGARILSIANAFDAMLSDRPYRKALPCSHACSEIRRCAGTQFDPKIVEVFLGIPVSHWIELREKLGSPQRE